MRRRRGGPQWLAGWYLCRHPSWWRSDPLGLGCYWAKLPERRGERLLPERGPGGRRLLWRHHRPQRWMSRWHGTSSGKSRRQSGCGGGQDTATLEVVREAAGPLIQGQVEGLGAPS